MGDSLLNKLILLLVLLVIIWPIKSGERKPPIIKVEYGPTEITAWKQKIDQTIEQAGFSELAAETKEEQTKRVRAGSYQFSWQYNFRKLDVPLFGPQGKLLSAYREQITAAFRANFPVVQTEWQATPKQVLIVRLGFKPQAETDVELITDQLKFEQPRPKAKLAVVIDDFGFYREGTEELLAIERPLTLAILPFRPQTKRDAKLARQAGQEIILHQPLEPLNPQADPGEGAVYTEMSGEKIKEIVRRNLEALPPVVGVNNHMGSKATASGRVMGVIMDVLKAQNLFYIDSSTAPDSVGLEIARLHGVPTTANHLFIDNVDDKEKIKQMILRLGKTALKKGELTIFGHVRENTALALQETIPQLEEMGIKLVYASQLVD